MNKSVIEKEIKESNKKLLYQSNKLMKQEQLQAQWNQ